MQLVEGFVGMGDCEKLNAEADPRIVSLYCSCMGDSYRKAKAMGIAIPANLAELPKHHHGWAVYETAANYCKRTIGIYDSKASIPTYSPLQGVNLSTKFLGKFYSVCMHRHKATVQKAGRNPTLFCVCMADELNTAAPNRSPGEPALRQLVKRKLGDTASRRRCISESAQR